MMIKMKQYCLFRATLIMLNQEGKQVYICWSGTFISLILECIVLIWIVLKPNCINNTLSKMSGSRCICFLISMIVFLLLNACGHEYIYSLSRYKQMKNRGAVITQKQCTTYQHTIISLWYIWNGRLKSTTNTTKFIIIDKEYINWI